MDLKNMTNNEKMDLAENLDTPLDLLRDLAKDASWGVKEALAENPSTPLDILREMATDVSYQVRACVATNPNTPVDILLEWTKDPNYWIRRGVAENPKSSSNILVRVFEYEKSLKKPSVEVIWKLYKNPKLPLFAKRVLETLFGDWL